MINVGIFGGTGYAGRELATILVKHKEVNIIFITSESHKNMKYSQIYKEFIGDIDTKLVSSKAALHLIESVDCVFLSLPHGKGFEIVKKSLDLNKNIIDLSGNFRLDKTSDYSKWYKFQHPYPELLHKKIYGLSEINYSKIQKSKLLSNPGCYPTSIILGLYPLLQNFSSSINLDSIIIDSKSGVSGAGKSPTNSNSFCEISGNIRPYGIGNHRHLPEIKQELSKAAGKPVDKITFVPHLVPYQRGILSTIYIKCTLDNIEAIVESYNSFYKNSDFIKLVDEPIQIKWITNSNKCFINISLDIHSQTLVITSAIDNLLKGAAGQAVQNFNIVYGFDQTIGLR